MNIAKTSWHYRINKFNSESFEHKIATGRYTTCSYIRATLIALINTAFKSLMVLAGFIFVLFIAGSMLVVPVIIYNGGRPPEFPAIMCISGWFAVICCLSYLFVCQLADWIERLSSAMEDRPKKERNVFVQAVIDKHNKFCTLVTAKDPTVE